MVGGSIKDRIINAIRGSDLVDKARLDEILSDNNKGVEADVIKNILEGEVLPDDKLLMILSRELDIPPIDVSRVTLSRELMSIIPEKVVRKYNILPISRIGEHMTIAISDLQTITLFSESPILTRLPSMNFSMNPSLKRTWA